MGALSKSEAQQRADNVRVFREELARVEAAGVVALSNEQRQAITSYHDGLLAGYSEQFDIDRDVQTSQLSLGMRIASFLGALALAASVFFLFYQYWGKFGPTTQVAILLIAVFGSLIGTLAIQRRDASGYFTKLAALVAFACFVLNISMFGQIFNITPSDKALLPWAAFAFLLAYLCDLRVLLVAGIMCVAGYVAARMGTWGGMYWLDFGERPENFYPAALIIFWVPQFVSQARYFRFAEIYRVFGLLLLFIPILILANWGHLSYLDIEAGTVEAFYQWFGLVGSAAAVWLGVKRRWPEVINTGVTMFVIFLYTKFYDWWWETMPKYLFFLVLGLTAIVLLSVFRRLRGYALKSFAERTR